MRLLCICSHARLKKTREQKKNLGRISVFFFTHTYTVKKKSFVNITTYPYIRCICVLIPLGLSHSYAQTVHASTHTVIHGEKYEKHRKKTTVFFKYIIYIHKFVNRHVVTLLYQTCAACLRALFSQYIEWVFQHRKKFSPQKPEKKPIFSVRILYGWICIEFFYIFMSIEQMQTYISLYPIYICV